MARSGDTRDVVQEQEGLVIDDARREEPAGGDEVTPNTELPTDPDEIIVEESAPETGAGHDAPEEGTQDSGLDPRAGEVGDLEYDDVGDTTGTDPGGFLDDFDEAMAGGEAGGVDGRNDASDYSGSGGGTGDIGGGVDAMGGLTTGLDGAAGKLPPHQQAVMDNYNQQAQEAAANGDFEAADRIAGEAQQFMIEAGVKQAAASPDHGEGTEMISNFGTSSGQQQQVWDSDSGEVRLVDDTSESESTHMVTEGVQLQRTGTAASGDGGEGTGTPSQQGGLNEDHLEGGSLPGHYNDPSEGWGAQDEANDWMLGTGGGVTDPTDEGGTDANAGALTEFDPETYTGDPGGPVVGGPVVTGHELDGFDPNAPVYDEVDGG